MAARVRRPRGERGVAWFDVHPENDNATLERGTRSDFAWFDDGVLGVSSIDGGLFVLKPRAKGGR